MFRIGLKVRKEFLDSLFPLIACSFQFHILKTCQNQLFIFPFLVFKKNIIMLNHMKLYSTSFDQKNGNVSWFNLIISFLVISSQTFSSQHFDMFCLITLASTSKTMLACSWSQVEGTELLRLSLLAVHAFVDALYCEAYKNKV